MRLNLGCGRDIRDGWVNIDCVPMPGIDHVVDFDDKPVLPFDDDSVAMSVGAHLIEHLRNPLPFMQELWRVTEPGGLVMLSCPYGSSDDADEDPTHVRRMYLGSWGYFSQPYHWRADYGYRGDWQPGQVELLLSAEVSALPDADVMAMFRHQRNVVTEMIATLACVKPRRAPDRALQTEPQVILLRQDKKGTPP